MPSVVCFLSVCLLMLHTGEKQDLISRHIQCFPAHSCWTVCVCSWIQSETIKHIRPQPHRCWSWIWYHLHVSVSTDMMFHLNKSAVKSKRFVSEKFVFMFCLFSFELESDPESAECDFKWNSAGTRNFLWTLWIQRWEIQRSSSDWTTCLKMMAKCFCAARRKKFCFFNYISILCVCVIVRNIK